MALVLLSILVFLFNPMLIAICLMAVYLLWVERKAWAGLVR